MHVAQLTSIFWLYHLEGCYILTAPNISKTQERDRGYIPALNSLSSELSSVTGISSPEVCWLELVMWTATKILAR